MGTMSGQERWAGGRDWLTCEKQKDNGVIFEDQAAQAATVLLWELPVQTMRTLSLNLDL